MKTAGIYVGSFNPFHIGHLDIAQKAKRIFGDVFIMKARSSEKSEQVDHHPINHGKLTQMGFVVGELMPGDLTTEFISRIEANQDSVYSAYSDYDSISLIRGLRNESDFVYEENLCAAYRRLKPDINIIHIMSNPSLNYVSSSLLRAYGHLEKFKSFIV